MTNRTTRKTLNKTQVESLLPFAKIVWDGDGNVTIEDNFPDTFKGRQALASVLYGAFQAVGNAAERLAPPPASNLGLYVPNTALAIPEEPEYFVQEPSGKIALARY